MSILSISQLYRYRNVTRNLSKSINESLYEFSSESKYGKITIFLSHKHDEREALDSAISFLKNFGVEVYVDWLDDGMPKLTSGKTAKRIKEKIKENRKFVFLATEGAINSKWCNWELGYGDSHKFIDNIAIFPIRNENVTFSGTEYLNIYPRIEYIEEGTVLRQIGGYFSAGYYVVTPIIEGESIFYTKLEDWLRK